MIKRLVANWVYGGALAGVLLLLLASTLTQSWPIALAATFLHLPVYMLHQYEEHEHDRFRLALNRTVGKGAEVLSPMLIFITNVPGVWGLLGVTIVLASRFALGWALIAVYLVLVNALTHCIAAIHFKEYNPGLATALLVFVPLGFYTMWQVTVAGGGTIGYHLAGLAVAVGIHALILIAVRRKQAEIAHAGRPAERRS